MRRVYTPPHKLIMSKYVQVDTTLGSFVLELYVNHAPKSCFNIETLAKIGYYDDSSIHRIIKDFMVQMGDPTGTGRVCGCVYFISISCSVLLIAHIFIDCDLLSLLPCHFQLHVGRRKCIWWLLRG